MKNAFKITAVILLLGLSISSCKQQLVSNQRVAPRSTQRHDNGLHKGWFKAKHREHNHKSKGANRQPFLKRNNGTVKSDHGSANDVLRIMKKALAAQGRKDVKFEVSAYGEDPKQAQFQNTYPEERFYNRAVMIDLVPVK